MGYRWGSNLGCHFHGNYDTSNRMRYLVGKDAKMFWTIRRYFGDSVAIKLTKKILGVL